MVYHKVGTIDAPAADTDIVVSWRGAYASHLHVRPQKEDVLIGPNTDQPDDGLPLIAKKEVDTIWDAINFSGFTIQRPLTTAVYVRWW